MKARILRVVPLYWVFTILTFSVAVVAPFLTGATRPDLVELMKSLFFVSVAKRNGLVEPVLFVGSTLNYEMFSYMIFSIFLLARTS
jgi:exopolysaccharide production protein ExoZ